MAVIIDMNAKMINGYLESELRRYGFSYTVENGYVLMTAGLGGRRWKTVILSGENRITCYAAYPRLTPPERRISVLERLNDLNAASGFGSYFLLDTDQGCLIVFRCDILIADVYSIAECFRLCMKNMSAAIYAQWETLMQNSAFRINHSP